MWAGRLYTPKGLGVCKHLKVIYRIRFVFIDKCILLSFQCAQKLANTIFILVMFTKGSPVARADKICFIFHSVLFCIQFLNSSYQTSMYWEALQ